MKRIAALLIAIAACLSAAPAGVAGKWQLTAKDPYDVTIKAELVLQQNGNEWSGSVQGPDGSIPLRNVSFKDSTLVCTLTYQDAEVTLTMKLEGDLTIEVGNMSTEINLKQEQKSTTKTSSTSPLKK